MYVRIDKLDGSRQSLTREELAARLSKRMSLVDEEITLIDQGAPSQDDFGWFIRELVPGLRGTASQNAAHGQGDDEPESHVVNYGDRFYLITPDGMDRFSDFGAEVCAGEMTSDAAMYQVLVAEGVEGLTPPDQLEPDTLGALCALLSAADYFSRSILSGDFIELDETARRKIAEHLQSGLNDKLGRAQLVIGRFKDEAQPTPRLVELRRKREAMLYERLKVEILGLLLSYDLKMVEGVRFFNREEWNRRGENFGRDTILTMTFEGDMLYQMLNSDDGAANEFHRDLRELLAASGYRYEMTRSWSISLYTN
jgi:hypothetical protein